MDDRVLGAPNGRPGADAVAATGLPPRTQPTSTCPWAPTASAGAWEASIEPSVRTGPNEPLAPRPSTCVWQAAWKVHDSQAMAWSPPTSPAKLSPDASRLAGDRLRTMACGAMSVARTSEW